jgi:hypothetical protein
MSNLRYFSGSILTAILGLILGGALGYYYQGTWSFALEMVFLVAILSVLEISLSFDNAVVNATVLRDMTPVWRHRFITWGMLIAVFGMRLVFPLAIVAIIANVDPWNALVLAAVRPEEYARIMLSAHVPVAAFGGSFLLMVGLKYFFDAKKDEHWIQLIEEPLTKLGRMQAIELAISLAVLYFVSKAVEPHESQALLTAGIWGLVTFIAVDGIGAFLELPDQTVRDVHKASAGMFLYLEVLDASFSFDGVVGAFALTNNLFIIAIGLGVGAMFVRSLTIMLVDRGTLTQYRYLEHGAFYAILALAAMMFLDTMMPIPEVVTGLIGAGFIALSMWSSVQHNRRQAANVYQEP